MMLYHIKLYMTELSRPEKNTTNKRATSLVLQVKNKKNKTIKDNNLVDLK